MSGKVSDHVFHSQITALDLEDRISQPKENALKSIHAKRDFGPISQSHRAIQAIPATQSAGKMTWHPLCAKRLRICVNMCSSQSGEYDCLAIAKSGREMARRSAQMKRFWQPNHCTYLALRS
jgi:hypothetical protein